MRFVLLLLRNVVHRNSLKKYSTRAQAWPLVKVVSVNDEDSIKISLKVGNSNYLNIKSPNAETVDDVLSRIKRMAALQRTKDEIQRIVENKYSNVAQVAVETMDDYVTVSLISNDKIIDERTPNAEAWAQASYLTIGDVMYKIYYNSPYVLSLTLPNYILTGSILRPHFILECASIEDCTFIWYRSVKLNNTLDKDINLNNWVKVGDQFHYFTNDEDVGCHLKLVCTPKQKDRVGPEFTTISKNVVEVAPNPFPLESRHAFTPMISDKNSFRCVSYNTLANVYVERKKFPYASIKARDIYYRKQLLFKELLGYNSDIICLQEVQERVFEYDFLPIFKKEGFKGFYTKKGGRRNEGLATFLRSSKFNIVSNVGILLNEIVKERSIFADLLIKVSGNHKDMGKLLLQDTALQVFLAESTNNAENKIIVANTHLYSNKDMPEVRLMQAALCIYYLRHFISTRCPNYAGVVFCGDFNSLPLSDVYRFITTGSFECCPSWKNSNINPNSVEDTTLRHNLNLESACGTPEYTNYTEEFHGCLDYIFYNKSTFEVTDTVPMPSHDYVAAEVALPSSYFPSDHLALVCTLKWKRKDV